MPDATYRRHSFMTSRFSSSLDRVPRHAATVIGALALAFLAPASVLAQEPEPSTRPATHTVKTGDTLWDLARLYLGDPFLWPEIYRINTNVVEDPHWIFPGEVLRLPGALGPDPVVAGGLTPTDPVVEDLPVESTGPTVFGRPNQRIAQSAQRLGGYDIDPRPVVRMWEYYGAPYIPSNDVRRGAGEIIASTEISGISAVSTRQVLQPNERVYIRVPRNNVATNGERYLSYRLGPDLAGIGQVIIPTAVLVTEEAHNGDATVVRIERQFQDVHVGNRVIPLEPFVAPPAGDTTPVDLGVDTKIAWIMDEPALASLQSYFVIDVTRADGVKLGDEFHVYRERTRTDRGDHLPSERIAVAHVVRVTDDATTLIVTGMRHAAIQPGTRTKLMARMP